MQYFHVILNFMSRIHLLCTRVPLVLSSISQRIKFTSLDASASYLIFGANTGSLYVFSRRSLELARLISLSDVHEPVRQLRICSNDEDLVAFSTGSSIHVLRMNLNDRSAKEKIIMKIGDHKADVTCLLWSAEPNAVKLYSADAGGAVHMTDMQKVGGTQSVVSVQVYIRN